MSIYDARGTWPKRPGSPLDEPLLRKLALAALGNGATIAETARLVGCSSRTIDRWKRRDIEVRRVYESATETRLLRTGQAPSPHGSTGRYDRYGCRCGECRRAWADHMRAYYHRKNPGARYYRRRSA